MELFPSEYQNIELNRHEKLFIRYAANEEKYGLMLLNINPAMIKGEKLHAVITEKGIVFCKFFIDIDASMLASLLEIIKTGLYETTISTIRSKLLSNKALVGEDARLAFQFTYLFVFPQIKSQDVTRLGLSEALIYFLDEHCIFAEKLSMFRHSFADQINEYLACSSEAVSTERMIIQEKNVNAILQRIAPEYTTVRTAVKTTENSKPGAPEELLVVTDDDVAVRAFRLEQQQVNIVNKISKGEQLILACAGSGKSVLLISKCFKAAKMNPDKMFLITCYNRNLQSLYTWFIERAGLQERNVECYTYDALCKRLLEKNSLPVPQGNGDECIERRRKKVEENINNGTIKTKYYGIFVDEVQMFETGWYKNCFNLLENKDSNEHIFVICGDKTQEIKQRQRHGRAPWNAGEGYPSFRGGNKSIRIEKNFRNCIEINDYINCFVQNARVLLSDHIRDYEYDPDLFLRGQAFRHGSGVTIKQVVGTAVAEAEEVVKSIKELHDEEGIPYDEIAVLMYNKQFKPFKYYLESPLRKRLLNEGIPYCCLYTNEDNWSGRYGDGGVSLITFDSTLGLDFQAVIACGIRPLGVYDKTKKIQMGQILEEEAAENLKKNISYLYVACTRAKDYLHIILSEPNGKSINNSIYNRLLLDSNKSN